MAGNRLPPVVLKQLHLWVLGALLALVTVLLNLPPNAADRIKTAVSALFIPLFGLAGSAQSFVDRAAYSTFTRSTLIRELERTRQANRELQAALMQARQQQEENTRLRALLGWQPRQPWTLRAARVVGRDPTTWWRNITIDFGTRDGARVGQPVLTSEGLVGRIREAGTTQSTVALIGDPECGVSITIVETREQGIIQEARSAPIGEGLITLKTLQHSPGTMAGQNVVTSGLGGVFPPGIAVGQIVDTRSVGGGLYTEARLRLAAQLNRLEEVWVLTNPP